MDSRSIVILILSSVIIVLVVFFIWTYRSRQRFSEKQRLVEAEIRTHKKMLDDVREELDQLKKERVCFDAIENRRSFGIITGIAYIDNLLTEKQKICIQKGIDFSGTGSQWPDMNGKREYMIRLLGNLLDNAIEAAEKAEEEKKYVKIESHILKGQWVLTVANSKSSSEHPLERGMRTTKPDASMHGNGTRIIDKTVKRMGGYVKRFDEDERFTVRVLIPVEERERILPF